MAAVLVIDDMPMHLDYVKEELERLGHDVDTADNGEEGLRRITQSRPDIVLLDMSMPVMDGLQVLRALRADPAYEGLPVILLTARKEFEDRVQGLDAGADDFITKPFHVGEVAARIKALLRIQDLQRRVVDRERRVSHLEGVAQTMVTLAHHINNATQSIAGIAQLCAEAGGSEPMKEELVRVASRQCAKITAVLQSLQRAVERADVRTASYAGQPDRMLDIEEDLRRRLEALGLD